MDNLDALKKEIPYKWKVQTAKSWGCECVAYIDARDVMDLLDEVVGPENWSDEFFEIGGKMFCRLSLKVNDTWISKQDVGTPSNMDADKGEASDAFKRAAVKWGIGRFLYDLGTVRIQKTVEANGKFFPADNYGKRIYDVTKYINESGLAPNSKPQPAPAPKKSGYTPKPVDKPVETPAVKPATLEQRDRIQALCQEKNITGPDFQKQLKTWGMKWKDLTEEQAFEALSNLVLIP